MTQLLGILIALALVLGFVYVLMRPHWAVVLVIVMFPLEQLVQSYVPGLLFRPWAFNVAVGGVAMLALLLRFGRQTPIVWAMRNPVFYLVLGIMVLAIVGLLWTPSPDRAKDMMRLGAPYYVLLLLVMPLLLLDLREFSRVLIGTMLAGTAIAALILINPQSQIYGGRLMMELGPGAVSMARGNPLALASMGGMLALIAALIRFPRSGWLLNGLRIAAFVFGIGLAIRSGSRGQVLATAITAVVFYPLAREVRNPKQFLLVGLGFITLLLVIYASFKFFIGLDNLNRWDSGLMMADATGRLERAGILLGGWLAEPARWLLGLGPNAFTALYPQESYVHNLFVEVLCEEGLVGAVMLAMILYLLYRGGRWLWQANAADPVMRSTAAVLLAICAFELLVSLKQGSFLLSPAPFHWFLVLAKLVVVERALVAAEQRGAEEQEEPYAEAFETYSEGDAGVVPAP